MTGNDTTQWALGMGGWWRRERGAVLRVRTRTMPPRDDEAQWMMEVDARRVSPDAPTLHCHVERTAAEGRAWCDKWALWLLREIAP